MSRCLACDTMLKTDKEWDNGYCQKCLKLVDYYEHDDGVVEQQDEDFSAIIGGNYGD